MSEDRAPGSYLLPTGDDLVPGMVTVVEDRGPVLVTDQPGRTEGFDVVLRGYDRHQVDQHLARTAALVTDQSEALAAGGVRESALAAELAAVRAELDRGRPTFDSLGERVGQMLALAETEAAAMRADAERDATALRQAAEREAADIRSDARRDADELGAAARLEVASLSTRREQLLADVAAVRDQLDAILTGVVPDVAAGADVAADAETAADVESDGTTEMSEATDD